MKSIIEKVLTKDKEPGGPLITELQEVLSQQTLGRSKDRAEERKSSQGLVLGGLLQQK